MKNLDAVTLEDRVLSEVMQYMALGVDAFQKEIQNLSCWSEPELLPRDRHSFRQRFLREELDEADAAYELRRLEDVIDAYVDMIYVALGALLEMGVMPAHCFDPVQLANMRKRRGETKRGHAVDAMKPEGWEPPDHSAHVAQMALLSKVSPVFIEATKIVIERGAAYNGEQVRREDHFPFGMKSVFQMMWVKIMRMRADLDAGRAVNRDHLIDLINYSRFGVDLLDGREMR